MLSRSRSNENSGVWMPIVTSPSDRYRSSHARTYGSDRSQLMHVYVQKSATMTFPRRPSGVSGSELSHAVAPENDGSHPSAGRWTPGEIIG